MNCLARQTRPKCPQTDRDDWSHLDLQTYRRAEKLYSLKFIRVDYSGWIGSNQKRAEQSSKSSSQKKKNGNRRCTRRLLLRCRIYLVLAEVVRCSPWPWLWPSMWCRPFLSWEWWLCSGCRDLWRSQRLGSCRFFMLYHVSIISSLRFNRMFQGPVNLLIPILRG